MVKKYTVIDRIDAIVKWIILIIVGVFTAFPFLWMVVSAFKTKEEIMDTSKFLPQSLHWENFITVIFNSPIPRYIVNSLLISLAIVFIQIITGALIAYAIVFMKFKGRGILFGIIMVTYMLPTAATYIPSYIILANHQLLNTYTGLIISSSVSIFGIFLLRQAFMQVPSAMVEAAQIDGAGKFQTILYVVVPLIKNTIMTNAMLTTLMTLGAFGFIWIITAGGPGDATQTLPILMYQKAFKNYELGYGTAISMILLLVSAIFGLIYTKMNGKEA